MKQVSTLTKPTYTVVSCHYGDLFWIEHMLNQVHKHSAGQVREAVIVDQSRNSAEALAELPLVSHVLTFEPNAAQIAVEGHDHPSALRSCRPGNRIHHLSHHRDGFGCFPDI